MFVLHGVGLLAALAQLIGMDACNSIAPAGTNYILAAAGPCAAPNL